MVRAKVINLETCATLITSFLYNSGINYSDLKSYDTDPNDMAMLPYSSGTTGLPKGVMLSHKNVIANISQTNVKLPYERIAYDTTETHQDISLGLLPFFHSYGLMAGLCFGLFSGMKMVSMPNFAPDTFLRMCSDYRPNIMNLVPPLGKPVTNFTMNKLMSIYFIATYIQSCFWRVTQWPKANIWRPFERY